MGFHGLTCPPLVVVSAFGTGCMVPWKCVGFSRTRRPRNTSAPDVINAFRLGWAITSRYHATLPTFVDTGITRAGTAARRVESERRLDHLDARVRSIAHHAGHVETDVQHSRPTFGHPCHCQTSKATLLGRVHGVGRRAESIGGPCLDLADDQHMTPRGHDVDLTRTTPPISVDHLEPVTHVPGGNEILAPGPEIAIVIQA